MITFRCPIVFPNLAVALSMFALSEWLNDSVATCMFGLNFFDCGIEAAFEACITKMVFN
jgi:hypothetical protein